MDSKEFGLVATHQLLQPESLHYGFWEPGEVPAFAKLKQAQQKHTAFLLSYITVAMGDGIALDSGCATGFLIRQIAALGHRADGLEPSPWLAARARENTADCGATIHGCRFEDLPIEAVRGQYSLVYFSESFQYVALKRGFEILSGCLSDQGKVVIFDFFSRDGVPGKSPLGGGHSLRRFYDVVEASGFRIIEDMDVTENLAPNLDLIQDVIVNRLVPFMATLRDFLSSRYRFSYRLLSFFARKRLGKLGYKYSEARNGENFRKYKSYRLIVLQKKPMAELAG